MHGARGKVWISGFQMCEAFCLKSQNIRATAYVCLSMLHVMFGAYLFMLKITQCLHEIKCNWAPCIYLATLPRGWSPRQP